MREIFEQVAEEFGISPEMVEDMYRHKFTFFRTIMREQPGTKILDNHYGTFYVEDRSIRNYILAYYRSYRLGRISREVLKEKVTELCLIRKRVRQATRTSMSSRSTQTS